MGAISQKIFCAFCRLERTVFIKKSIGWTNVLLCLLSSLILMYILWQNLDGRVSIIFAFSLMIAEVFVRVRWRMGMPCPHCKFDPVIYKRDKQKAMEQVRLHLEGLAKSGRYLVKQNNPFLHLPVVRVDKETQKKTISYL